jgi:hypothetical protein
MESWCGRPLARGFAAPINRSRCWAPTLQRRQACGRPGLLLLLLLLLRNMLLTAIAAWAWMVPCHSSHHGRNKLLVAHGRPQPHLCRPAKHVTEAVPNYCIATLPGGLLGSALPLPSLSLLLPLPLLLLLLPAEPLSLLFLPPLSDLVWEAMLDDVA